MKTFYAGVLAALICGLSSNALADDTPGKNSTGKTEQTKKVKPHSHLDEKGIAHGEPDKAKKKNPKKGTTHQHERDAK